MLALRFGTWKLLDLRLLNKNLYLYLIVAKIILFARDLRRRRDVIGMVNGVPPSEMMG